MPQTRAKTRIFHVAFGGNVDTGHGSLENTMRGALNRLVQDEIRITSTSQFYDTPAFPIGSGPNFVNGVIELQTTLTADELLARLHEIEKEFGRLRQKRWGARTLDLDILSEGQAVHPNAETWRYWFNLAPERQQIEMPDTLILPHPRLHERAFVLVPFNDVAPNWLHPVLGLTVAEMLEALPENLRNEVKPL